MVILSIYYKHKEGGFNKRLYRVYEALSKAGHEVHYLACESFPIKHDRIHFHRLRVPFSDRENVLFWLAFLFIAPVSALSLSLKIRPDKIAVFGSWYATFVLLPRIFLGCPVLLFLRADSVVLYRNEKRNPMAKGINYVLEYLGVQFADKIWTNIGKVRKNVIGRYHLRSNKVNILHNNIEEIRYPNQAERAIVRKTFGLKENTFVIATSGIFYKRKNIEFLINAFHNSSFDSDVVLLIVGDDVGQGTERIRLEKLVAELEIQKSVVFTGWRKDSESLIAASDLYVLPTLHEGFPNSLLDAFSVGCVCMGSRIDEISEILYYDELMFSINDVAELSAKMFRLATDETYRNLLADLSQKRAQKFCFDWDSQILTLFDVKFQVTGSGHD